MPKHPTKILVTCFWTGWIALIVSEAVYFFVLPHRQGFAPELGVSGAFRAFAMIYTFFYLLTALALLFPILYLLRRTRLSSRFWIAAPAGGFLFAALCYAVCALWIELSMSGTILACVLWLVAGSTATGTMAYLLPRQAATRA